MSKLKETQFSDDPDRVLVELKEELKNKNVINDETKFKNVVEKYHKRLQTIVSLYPPEKKAKENVMKSFYDTLINVESDNSKVNIYVYMIKGIEPNISTWRRYNYNKYVIEEQLKFVNEKLDYNIKKSIKNYIDGYAVPPGSGHPTEEQLSMAYRESYTAIELNECLRETDLGKEDIKFKNKTMETDYYNITKAFNEVPPLKYDLVVYRGSGFEEFKEMGMMYSPAFVSTSLSKKVAQEFTLGKQDKNVFTIKILRGSKVLPIFDLVERYTYGKEILLNRGSQFICGWGYEEEKCEDNNKYFYKIRAHPETFVPCGSCSECKSGKVCERYSKFMLKFPCRGQQCIAISPPFAHP